MNSVLAQLNSEQRECVEHDTNVLQIMAGPGSGKVSDTASMLMADACAYNKDRVDAAQNWYSALEYCHRDFHE
jgi:hypothetical protein